MRRWLVLGIFGVAACTGGGTPMDDAGIDAPPNAYTLAIAATVLADGATHAPVAITGQPNDRVVVVATAGTVPLAPIALDSAGHGSLDLVACDAVTAGCAGTIQLTLALASSPADAVAHASTLLVAPAEVGDVAPCLTGGNVFHARGSDGLVNGTVTSDPADAWTATALPDHLELDVGPASDRYTGRFSLLGLPAPLAVGTYEQAQRDAYATAGHPGLALERGGSGCNALSGRFRVHAYTADPVTGVLSAVTVSFEELCDTETTVVSGCFHYETTPLVPMPPPPPDPTKVSVEVRSANGDGTADTTAIAIFRDHGGAVIQDAQVDAYGRAEAALPAGGELTVIHPVPFGDTQVYTYRDVVTGDHVVIHPVPSTIGTEDQMLASFTPPPGTSNLSVMTACGGSGWSPGTGIPNNVYLPFRDACRAPTFSMLALAQGASGNQFVWQTGLTHAPNGNVTVASTWAPLGAATLTLANIPGGTASLAGSWYTQFAGQRTQSGLNLGAQRIDGPVSGDRVMTFSYPPGAGEQTDVNVDTLTSITSSESREVVATGAPAAITLDFAALPVPLPSQVAQSVNGATWTRTAGSADVRTLYWHATLTSQRVAWTVVEPDDGQAQATLPTLPPAHADLDPTADPGTQLSGTAVSYLTYDVSPGYRVAPPPAPFRSHSATASTFGF